MADGGCPDQPTFSNCETVIGKPAASAHPHAGVESRRFRCLQIPQRIQRCGYVNSDEVSDSSAHSTPPTHSSPLSPFSAATFPTTLNWMVADGCPETVIGNPATVYEVSTNLFSRCEEQSGG